MKVLIIGGNRYFGLRLAKKITEAGHQLTLLNRGNLKDDLGRGVERIVCDRSSEPDFRRALTGREFDIVYDQICYNSKDAVVACEVFSDKIKRYIFTSTMSVYDGGRSIKEAEYDPFTYPVCIEAKPSDYQLGKRQAESVFHQKATFPVLSVRFPVVLGPDDYTKRFIWHVEKIKKGEEIYFPDMNVSISLIHAQDAADFLYFNLEKNSVGPVNVASSEPVKLSTLMSLIEVACDKKLILAKTEIADNGSPVGPASDFWLNVEKMQSMGFQTQPILDWVSELLMPAFG
ncbi:MAG: NAD-dependent epimerase/dehydratase family protein [Pseudomonadota bacterium]|nr:NAD-dependent epimerase/dehydratase family protein [Pseudomonadota bacterium]